MAPGFSSGTSPDVPEAARRRRLRSPDFRGAHLAPRSAAVHGRPSD